MIIDIGAFSKMKMVLSVREILTKWPIFKKGQRCISKQKVPINETIDDFRVQLFVQKDIWTQKL